MQPEIPSPKAKEESESALILTFAHDLRQPLRSIVVSTQRIQRSLHELNGDTKAKLEEILAAAKRQDELIASVVEYDQALHVGLSRDNFLDLKLVIQTAWMKVDSYRQSQHGSIRFDQDVIPRTLAPSGLSRVIEKVLHNSLKFHPPESQPMVEIQVSEANSGLTEIRVSDQGLGVEPQHREMVFGPFKRLNPLSEFPGSGLGLSTCRRLVESIGGTIRFEDCEKGAVVVVRFPGNELEG